MSDDVDKTARSEQRKMFHALWERAKKNDYDGLDDEQRRICEALKLHEDEFHNVFEFADVIHDGEYNPEDEVNPFLHISIHTAVQAQIESKDPIEVSQFYNAMRKKKCDHHDALHLIGAILAPLMFDTMRNLMPFDTDRYVSLLKKYKTRKPEKIMDFLEGEFRDDETDFQELFGEVDGPCRMCEDDGPVGEDGLCETCTDKLERDMLRNRLWGNSLTASYLSPDQYEDLRRDVIEQFGREMELLTKEDLQLFKEKKSDSD